MSTARYGGAAYGGRRTPTGGVTGALLVPGFNASYTVSTRGSGRSAYGQAAYGGRRTQQRPAAGLFAVPDPDAGAITIPWWAAYVDLAAISRVEPDGTRTPVRGAEAMHPAGPWRRNPASNPVARDSAEGYTAGNSNTTIGRVADRPQPVERVRTAVRGTAAAAGQVQIVTSLDPAGPMTTALGASLRTSAVPADLGVLVAWYDGTSALISTSAYLAGDAVRQGAAAGAVSAAVTVDTWPTGAALGVVSWAATGLPAGGWLEVSCRITEPGSATLTGPWFDGDSLAAAWVGTPGLSHSAQGALATLVDAEAPLDTDLAYELTLSTIPGWVARSTPVRLPSAAVFGEGGRDRWRATRRCLLTHPGQARTIGVWVQDAPTIAHELEQETHALPGRRRKVVVSADVRSGAEGELIFVTETSEERARLLELLDDGSPLLVRLPPDLQYPPVWWLAFGSLSTEPLERSGRSTFRRITAPFVEVDRPAVATRALAA